VGQETVVIMPDKALYTPDGEPANLPAAVYDALEWLQVFRRMDALRGTSMADEARPRLRACIEALEEWLRPSLPPETAPLYTGVVAEVVASSRPLPGMEDEPRPRGGTEERMERDNA
jgi:hypothetical protein